ncbi:sugar dehydrogenase [Halobacteriales archaeon SW_7_68_16]|nr:MAG: sugar dehydrogenase [Halobacteriales archaeon SW_7_68_16]
MPGPHTTRRSILAGSAGVAASLAGCLGVLGGDNGSGGGSTGDPIPATRIASGLTAPLDVAAADGLDRLLVVDQVGTIHAIDGGDDRPVDVRDRDPYLDLRDRTVTPNGYDERGLLGIAPGPAFADTGRLFVRYSAPAGPETPDGYGHTSVLAELSVDPAAATTEATERRLLGIPQPQGNHNAGSIVVGPDGYLYVGVGDGGAGGDRGLGHPEDWYDAVPGGNGQSTDTLLGSVLRIDPGGDSHGAYGVPTDNPLVDTAGRDELYAWGFRNPWRFSFDPAGDRLSSAPDLYVADVGQDRHEEVDLVEPGGNYGWNVREGPACFQADDCPTVAPDGRRLAEPVVTYSHAEDDDPAGQSVVGGYRHRGPTAALDGRYVFADWAANERLFLATPGEAPWSLSVRRLAPDAGSLQHVLSFGRSSETLYVAGSATGVVVGESGGLYRIGD